MKLNQNIGHTHLPCEPTNVIQMIFNNYLALQTQFLQNQFANAMKKSLLPIFSFAVLVFFTGFCCQSQKKSPLSLMQNSPPTSHESEWRVIDSLERMGLPKSALEKVDALFEKVEKEKNAAQIVKCLIYKGKFQNELEEDGLVKAIHQIKRYTDKSAFPAKAVLESMLAEMYFRYLYNNRWKFEDRTTLVEQKSDDISTWSIEDLTRTANSLYLASLQYPESKSYPVENFKDILLKGELVDGLRPSLYDFLAHRAIDHFMNERSLLNEPAYAFVITQAQTLGSTRQFVDFKLETKDTASFKYQTLLLFQNLLDFRMQASSPAALLDADLKRLKYVYQHIVNGEKDQLYLDALNKLEKQYGDNPEAAQIWWHKGQYYQQKGAHFAPSSSDAGRWELKRAYEIYEQAIRKYPKSAATQNCRSGQSHILQKQLRLSMEKVSLPGQPMLAQFTFRNIRKAHFRIVKSNLQLRMQIENMRQKERPKLLNSLSSIRSWSADLPATDDFQPHITELKVDALPLGEYLILASDNEEFLAQNHALAYTFIYVSELGYWSKQARTEEDLLVVHHRASGEPLADVKAEIYRQQYNSQLRKHEYQRLKTVHSDKDGFVKTGLKDHTRYFVKLTKGEDVLDLREGFYSYRHQNNNRSQAFTHFFLDRAIYRPGQTVYFKALLYKKDKERIPHILPNTKATITFYDVNRQKIAEQSLKSNEYGTLSGTFTAPRGGLLGRMSLASSHGNSRHSFRVEEYKRPKFEVKFNPVENSYRLDDEVTLSGKAVAFAGNVIDGAQVKYRVVREVRYPWLPWWYRRSFVSHSSMEIANGTTTTEADGSFKVSFPAIPDRAQDPKNKPEFYYSVTADVTDISGETRSAQYSVAVGYVALRADVGISKRVNRDSLKEVAIQTSNLNGQFEGASGKLRIDRLKTPAMVYRHRFWTKPDTQSMSKASFSRHFPDIAYSDEDEMHQWPVEREVLNTAFNTSDSKAVPVNARQLPPGAYMLTLETKDKYGTKVELKKDFVVYDLDEKSVPANLINFHIREQTIFQPGGTAHVFFGSASQPVNILYEVAHKNKIVHKEWLKIRSLKELKLPVLEKHRGNFQYSVSFAKDNRFYANQANILVPWDNKVLNFEYATFRDKLYPGQEEQWKIKISGMGKDRLAAEMVATLYDASLDKFAGHSWLGSFYPTFGGIPSWRANSFQATTTRLLSFDWNAHTSGSRRHYDRLNWFNWRMQSRFRRLMDMEVSVLAATAEPEGVMAEGVMADSEEEKSYVAGNLQGDVQKDSAKKANGRARDADDKESDEEPQANTDDIQVRSNLKETVFFFPHLTTDEQGNVILNFTMNEALTRWKFLAMAHTKDMEYGFTDNAVVTQKDLMVMPNAPRFLREGDEIEFTAKVSNLTETDMSGTASLLLFDATTMKPVDELLANQQATVSFSAKAGQSDRLAWKLKVPVGKVPALVHRVIAKAGSFSDGEESALPILSNRMLVTETQPLPVKSRENKTFVFQSMQDASGSNTLQHHRLTLEFTSNPAWYAVQALPYLMEYPYECTEQIFSRYYANSLATSVANSHPRIRRVFEQWRDIDTEALQSNLSKNQELKSALLEETPWVLNAQSEEQQKKNIALLFDLNRMSDELDRAMRKMSERQLGNGGFAWFPGGRDNWYITQYIVEGLGHLDKLGVASVKQDERVSTLVSNAVRYTDARILEQYEELKRLVKEGKASMDADNLNYIAIHYLYARSFFKNLDQSQQLKEAADYYLSQAKQYWTKRSYYMQGMMGLALHRSGDTETAGMIVKSLKERAIVHDELGMYWKYGNGYYWYQLPIESHALMIELFDEVTGDQSAVEDMKVWLLKTKQTTHWKTTKATASAVYALLMSGDNWLLEDQPVQISLGSTAIDMSQVNREAGTGYFKKAWTGSDISSDMATIKVQNPNNVIAWGALYWQYFEQLDKIKTFEDTPLQLKKQLFIERPSDTGPKLEELLASSQLRPGDKIKVRIELRVDRPMEYVHMKDMRASGFEPINVLSEYKWQGGLGYYESTRDASTNFFFGYLPRGTYVFEYPLRATHKGDFSNGITSIQCMYAPEFSSHSEGVRVEID